MCAPCGKDEFPHPFKRSRQKRHRSGFTGPRMASSSGTHRFEPVSTAHWPRAQVGSVGNWHALAPGASSRAHASKHQVKNKQLIQHTSSMVGMPSRIKIPGRGPGLMEHVRPCVLQICIAKVSAAHQHAHIKENAICHGVDLFPPELCACSSWGPTCLGLHRHSIVSQQGSSNSEPVTSGSQRARNMASHTTCNIMCEGEFAP